MPASLLGNLVYAGFITLLTSSDTDLGGTNAAMTLYSLATGANQNPDVALFQPGTMQGTGAIAAGIGHGQMTLPVQLFTRTGATTVWYNPNTTVVAGDIYVAPCCRAPHLNAVPLSVAEAQRLPHVFGATTLPGGTVRLENVALLARHPVTGECAFVLGGGRCSIWSLRPKACRAYTCATDPLVKPSRVK